MSQICNRCSRPATHDVRTPGDLDIPTCRVHLQATIDDVMYASNVTKVDVHERK